MASLRTLRFNTAPTTRADGRPAIAKTYCPPDTRQFEVYYVDPTTGQDNCDKPEVVICGTRNDQWPSVRHFLESIGVKPEDALIEPVK